MREITVRIHEIATDGMPDMDALVGRVAFIFDGCIVSGWPLGRPERRISRARHSLGVRTLWLEAGMTTDLLRRAAAKLRQHAEQAVDPLTEGAPWTVETVASGVEPDEAGVFVVAERNNLTSYIAESFLTNSHATYVALMHPPVALALAELIDSLAVLPAALHPIERRAAEELARAILRTAADG